MEYRPDHLLHKTSKLSGPRGAVVICLGYEFRRLARIMVLSLLKSGWKYPIMVLSDQVEDSFPVRMSHIRIKEEMSQNKRVECSFGHLCKICSYFITPFDETLFLDVDLIIGSDISDIWQYSGDCLSIVQERITPKLADMNNDERNDTIKICGRNTPYYNSGVMLFRKCKEVEKLFKTWRSEWRGKKDQPALSRAICLTKAPVTAMPMTYNYMLDRGSDLCKANNALRENKIVHFWLGLKRLMYGL